MQHPRPTGWLLAALLLASAPAASSCSSESGAAPPATIPATDASAGADADAFGGSDASPDRDGSLDAADAAAEPPVGPPVIDPPGDQTVQEDSTLKLKLAVQPPSDPALRVWLTGLPPGAHWDEASRELTFTPDFIQGGDSWTVQIVARNAAGSSTSSFQISAVDSIHPPWPTIDSTDTASGYKSLWMKQETDDYLDSPGYAGRSLSARVIVPDGADASNRMPVRVYLHGFGGGPYDGTSSGGQYRIYPHDPMNSYWWGYASSLPSGNPDHGPVPNYTQRRVLHLVEWLLRNHPGADPRRVYVTGGSMGGAGAATLGLLYARHFAFVDFTIGQTIPRNHRPDRIAQLQQLWGSPALDLDDGTALEDGAHQGVWDRQDLTRVLGSLPEARAQHLFSKHGKDDPTIHFGAVVLASPMTNRSYFDTLREEGIGHYAVWDEGGHGSADPVMPADWWDSGWSRVFDPDAWLRRDTPFPAFSHASHDWDPGDGTGNGKQPWNDNSGYGGEVGTAGDTGWSGDIAGARNRFLRWDSNAIVDTIDKLSIPLFVVDGTGQAPPKAGYPSVGDRLDRPLPIVVDVTLRRAQAFVCRPGEPVHWSFGSQSGVAQAGADGSVTVPGLSLDTQKRALELTR
ncbi:MAG: hypothetical protein HY898_30220 [Deltaproteobacteria bacterium]|nr:hypothetical protein [Deltaproteobacteria bacterium]